MQATPKHAARIRWPDRVETAENSIQDDESQQILHISNFRSRVDGSDYFLAGIGGRDRASPPKQSLDGAPFFVPVSEFARLICGSPVAGEISAQSDNLGLGLASQRALRA